jgi:hypothetical protein
MAQRVTVIFIAIMLAMPLMARVQAASHPDFTGAWKLTNIDMPENGGGFVGGDRRGFGGRGGLGGRGGRGFGGARRRQGNDDPNNANGERPETMTVRTTADTPRGKQTMTVTYAKIDE